MADASANAIKRRVCGIVCGLGALLPISNVATAEPPTTIVVFDGSGSMWGRLGGDKETKFAGAREALRRALPKISSQTRVGLAAFGHRRKGDCSDTEVMLPPEPLDPARILAPLDRFNPKGKGPLVAALKEAGSSLAKLAGPASLILIHDDPDNCSQDPCAAAADLAKANPKLAVHVISIALDKDDAQRMACVPRLTGGRHFEAHDSAELGVAVEDALKLASLDVTPGNTTTEPAASALKPAAPAPVPVAEDNGPPGLKLSATLGKDGPSVIVPLAWRVTKSGSAAGAAPIAVIRAATLELALPPGAYDVEVQHGLVKATETVTVKPKGATQINVPFQAGAVRVSATLHKGTAPLEQAVFAITDVPAGATPSRTVWTGGADAPPVFLPVGTWRVTAELDRAKSERQVMVIPGAMIDANLAFGAGRLKVKASERDGGPALERVTFRVTEDDADSPDGRREVARSTAIEPEFTLSAGTYYLSARQGQAEVRERVLVNAGDEVARTLILALGRLSLQSKLAGSGAASDASIAYRVDRLDTQQETIRIGSATAKLELPAGRYRVESLLGAQNARVTREIEIKASAATTIAFEHIAANVQLKAAATAGSGDLLWVIRDAQDRVVWQSLQAQPRAYLAAGRYKVTAESRERRGHAEIEVKPGDVRVVEVQLE